MNKEYKSFYFLHIPKTGGRYINKYIFYHLRIERPNQNTNFKIKSLESNGHGGWQKNIKDDTYIVSILRDPVKLACSYFTHFASPYRENTKESFLKWIEKEKWFHNFQAKNFLFDTSSFSPKEYTKKFNSGEIEIDELNKRINRINFLFTTDYLKTNIHDICKKICTDLDLDIDKKEFPEDTRFSQPESSNLYNSLSEQEIKKISSLFSVDYYLYNKVRSLEI